MSKISNKNKQAIDDAIADKNACLYESDRTLYEAYAKIFENISRFYTVGIVNQKNVSVTLTNDEDTASCSKDGAIKLPIPLLKEFRDCNLPDFTVYYHELAHACFSNKLFKAIDKWKQLGGQYGLPQYEDKYFYIINWMEDFFIEAKARKVYPYQQNILGCLRKVAVTFDENDRKYMLHYFYRHQFQSIPLPQWMSQQEQSQFMNMFNRIQSNRDNKIFGNLIGTTVVSTNPTIEYFKDICKLFNWLVAMKIIDDVNQPPLRTPVHTNSTNAGSSNSNGNNGNGGKGGTHTAHSGKVGVMQTLQIDVNANGQIFCKELDKENQQTFSIMVQELIDTVPTSLEGLFTADKEIVPMIAEPIIPNFFNQRRLEDRMLFRQPQKAYNNVSIYRDISGSTCGGTHTLIDNVCQFLVNNIPIDYHFYLYSSGKISILECNYLPWQDSHEEYAPQEYKDNSIFQQFEGGTNSDAIADVITQQYSDKWLNIIVTDGDLDALMARDNIGKLLDNVAVVVVDCDPLQEIKPNHQVSVKSVNDLPKIIPMLLSFTK